MKLVDSLAAHSHHYERSDRRMADIRLLDIPAPFAGRSLPLGRYYPILVETRLEQIELDRFLTAERRRLVVPNLLDRRPSSLQGKDILIAHYDPAAEPWPFLLLCQWPRIFAASVPQDSDLFARAAYTVEIFPGRHAREAAVQALLASLSCNGLAYTLVTS
jgi:hypothetical protein